MNRRAFFGKLFAGSAAVATAPLMATNRIRGDWLPSQTFGYDAATQPDESVRVAHFLVDEWHEHDSKLAQRFLDALRTA